MRRNGNRIFYIILFLVISGLIYLLAPILTPFLAGALLAYLLNPAVNLLQKYRLSRGVSVAIVFFVLFSLLFLLILMVVPAIQEQMSSLLETVSHVIEWVETTAAPWLSVKLRTHQVFMNGDAVKSMLTASISKAGNVMDAVIATALQSGMKIAEWIFNLILIPVVTFYLLCDWKAVLKGFHNILPRHIEPTIAKLMTECDEVLSQFFRGQLLIILILIFYYSIGLTLVGLQTGIIIGTITGVLCLIPYLGFIVGISIGVLAALVQTGGGYEVALVCGVFIIGHIMENMFLTPKLIGDRIGLHPVVVIFSVLAGGSLFGFVGVLLALPAAAVIMVLLRFLISRYRKSDLYRAT